MQDDIAELRRQLEEERRAREEERWAREEAERRQEEAEQRQEEERRAREEERRAKEEERRAREEAEQRLQPNSLFRLLDRCHESLSQTIRVETNATLTTQGNVTDPVNRLFPKRIVPWLDFPQIQEQIWKKFERAVGFTWRPLFPSDTQLDYVATNVQDRPIYSEATLRNFERDTVDNFVEKIVEALRGNETLQREFGIEGRVAFYDRTNSTSLDDSLEMHLDDAPRQPTNTNRGRGRRKGKGKQMGHSQTRASSGRRRNRRADQFCVHVVADERQIPVYAVEFKAPHKLTVAELVAGLHEMDLARDVIDQEGDTFEFHTTRLVAAVVTQIFSYMHDLGIQNGCIRTGEAFVFLHIPEDPTIVQYYLCFPNQDVQAGDESRLHRTAVGQMLAFTLQALAAEAPSQEWHNTAHEQLSTWKVEYLDVLRDIPETIRKEPPPSNYRPSYWKPNPKTHNTRSHARCNPDVSTPAGSPSESSDSDEDMPSPSTAPATRSRSSRGKGKHLSTGGRERAQPDRRAKQTPSQKVQRPYCTMACIRGMVNGGPLDKKCPNWQHHGGQRHPMGPREFTRKLHHQLVQNRNKGFEPLHIRGRTGYLMKATLLSHGYTVVIKATTKENQHALITEVDNYRKLRSLQGYQVPVCLGDFEPSIAYWYHGQVMAHMMILSWSGTRLQRIIKDENLDFFHKERDKALKSLQKYGVEHRDKEWRNMLWDEQTRSLVVVDLEDMEWLKRPRPFQPTSGNSLGRRIVLRRKNKRRRLSSQAAVCTS